MEKLGNVTRFVTDTICFALIKLAKGFFNKYKKRGNEYGYTKHKQPNYAPRGTRKNAILSDNMVYSTNNILFMPPSRSIFNVEI